MRDADDAAILRQLKGVLWAAIFCLLCGAGAGIYVVSNSVGSGPDEQRIQLPPATRPGR